MSDFSKPDGSNRVEFQSRRGNISPISSFRPNHQTPHPHLNMEKRLMDTNTRTKSKIDASEQFRDMAERGAAQTKEALEKMTAVTGEAADIMKNCCSTAVKGAQDYNNKFFEFARANTNVVFDFAQRIAGVKSPSEFVELSTELAQKHLATLTEQTKELTALAQQVTLATAEPLRTGFTKKTSSY